METQKLQPLISLLSATHITELHLHSTAPLPPLLFLCFLSIKTWIHFPSVVESRPEASSGSLLSATIPPPPCKLFLTFSFSSLIRKFVESLSAVGNPSHIGTCNFSSLSGTAEVLGWEDPSQLERYIEVREANSSSQIWIENPWMSLNYVIEWWIRVCIAWIGEKLLGNW